MDFFQRPRRLRLQKWLLPTAVALLLLYTGDQLLTGERGIVTWRVMKGQVEALRQENDNLRAENAALERRIKLLKPKPGDGSKRGNLLTGRIDADYVDELVRRDLGYIKPGEQVILISGSSPR